MMDIPVALSTTASGAVVGLVLGLVGGGGSILAVPLLIYWVGIASPHVAIGTGAIAVSLSALGNVAGHARAGNVKWRCAGVFASAGVVGAVAGSVVAKAMDGQKLLALFGMLMVVVGLMMLRKRSGEGDPDVRLSKATARKLLPMLIAIGAAVGLLSGFFGIGGGFLIVPGLMYATGMPLTLAIGTSLVAVAAFGAATATSYAVSGWIDWPIAGVFVLGGLLGGIAGVTLGKNLAARKRVMNIIFAALVIVVGIYVVARGLAPLIGET
ncbi:MAG: sulfite exporter TauE/SafE family protein [Pseudolabrys sp.]|nr:sulfite exporter TauE/SafE family protein [Pseudolabrys sp.]MDP2297884.1 sulfite exporter TauE/SafE family protein [Pseudolabrys sp.]